MSLCIRIYGAYVCWLACEDEDTRDLHAGPPRALDGSEDDVVSSDIASGSSDVYRCARRALMHACLLLRT